MNYLCCSTAGCEFNKSIQEITNQQVFCHFQAAAPKYTGGGFCYCPFCGKELDRVMQTSQTVQGEAPQPGQIIPVK
jgi:hypothetical protein